MVNMLFARFMVIYGHKFKSAFNSPKELVIAKREWSTSIGSYDEDVLVAALEMAKQTYSWMPSIAEFLQLLEKCQQSFGLPVAEQAYAEACRYASEPLRHPWSHAAVYHAGKQTGWFELRTLTQKQMWPSFRHVYKALCDRVLAGEELVMPVGQALPAPSSSELFDLVNSWAEQQGLAVEDAQTCLYYLHLVERNPLRQRLLQQAQTKHPDIQFPATLADLRQAIAAK
ncbi:MAG: replication protein P [Gammaproteobacteria bacterium]|jgi:hypothetical protein|nr:replication protein P [Gammaproteobacteria bacterium]